MRNHGENRKIEKLHIAVALIGYGMEISLLKKEKKKKASCKIQITFEN